MGGIVGRGIDRARRTAPLTDGTQRATHDLLGFTAVGDPDRRPWLRLLTRGAETADAEELAANPRAASARVRAAERVAA